MKNPLYERIIELIHDEEKVVTCASLAKELKIPSKEANNLLQEFYKDSKELKLEEICVTYLLCGTLRDSKDSTVYLVKGGDLDDKKALFDSISTELVYSIQRNKQIDFNIIASANPQHENFVGCPISKNCVKRNIKTPKELPPLPTPSIKEKPNFFKKIDSGSNSKTSGENEKQSTQSSQKPQPKQNGGIASFFAKAPPKAKTGAKPDKKETVEEKSSVKVDTSPPAPIPDSPITEIELKHENMEIDPPEQPIKKKKAQTENNKKRKKQNKNDIPNKKRKRIQEVCDSDSSDMFDEEENEDIIDKSDEEPVHTPVVISQPVPKNKKRKAIDETYVDEEGFIVTNTKYVFESASEDEEKDAPKPQPEKKPQILLENKSNKVEPQTKAATNKGKNKKPVSGKQPTLMNFFKKS